MHTIAIVYLLAQCLSGYITKSTINSATMITFVVDENVPIGHEVGQLMLDTPSSDKKQLGSKKSLTFTLQDTSYFDFDTSHPNKLVVRKTLDRDADRKLCAESGWPEICAWSGVIFVSDGRLLSLRVVVRDVNDNTPSWPKKDNNDQPVLEVSITENRPIGTTLDLPLASDPDIGENSVVKYELTTTKENEEIPFDITTLSGPGGAIYRLVVSRPLDREKQSVYQLNLAAVDGGGNRGHAKLLVHITDENDNSPIFVHLQNQSNTDLNKVHMEMVINVDEDIPVGSLLPKHPVATDADEGEFGHITYRFSLSTSDVTKRDFRVDPETGDIIIRSPLDYDTGGLTQYAFVIVAEDGGSPPLTATARVVVNVKDKNDNAPEITITPALLGHERSSWMAQKQNESRFSTKPILTIFENTPPGALIATVTVSDPDTKENGKFTCQLGNTDEFSLVYLKNLGKLSVYQLSSIRMIDRESQPELRVTLRCRDHGSKSQISTELLTIVVLDVNDNAPQFTNKRFGFQVCETFAFSMQSNIHYFSQS